MWKSRPVKVKAISACSTFFTALLLMSSSGVSTAQPAPTPMHRQRGVCSLNFQGATEPKTLEAIVASAELHCESTLPVSIGVNSAYLGQHVSRFTGVQVVHGLPCQQQAEQGPWGASGRTTALLAMLYFCGDYHITLLQPRVLNVTLQQNSSDWTSAILAFGASSTATVLQGAFLGNSAGSTIVAFQSATVVVQDHSVFDHNRGLWGAGIAAIDEAGLVVEDVTFSHNSATKGGALGCNQHASISIDRCRFHNNTAGMSGGAVCSRCINGRQVTISNTTFQANSADFGGAVYLDNSANISVKHSSFTTNQGFTSGGGMYVSTNCTVTATGCRFDRGDAKYGGGLYCDSGSSIQAIWLSITHNNAMYGGGFYAYEAQVTISNTKFQANTAELGGAANFDERTTCSIENSIFTANHAVKSGGGIILAAHSTSTATAVTFDRNGAGFGGGINCDGCSLQAARLSFTHNNAVNYGGGLYAGNQAQVVMLESNISSCTAAYGGALSLLDQATLHVSGSSFKTNSANTNGGGLEAENHSRSFFKSSTFAGNYAGNTGAAAFVTDYAQMFISHNCSHVDNSASYGAAIAAGGRADLRLSNSSLSNNSADNTGGALYLLDTSVTLVTSCIISGNHAANSGGAGVFAGGISLLIINGDTKVQGNSAAFGGGVWASDLAQVIMKGTSVSGNQGWRDGGGFYFDAHARGNLTGCKVTSNVAGSDRILSDSTGLMAGGGLASFDEAVVILNNCLVANNKAFGNGGGILLQNSAQLMLLGLTSVTNNHADFGYGGGVTLFSSGFDLNQVIRAVHNNYGQYDENVQTKVARLTIVGNTSIFDFANRIGSDEGLLHVVLNVSGHYGVPCQAVQAQAVLGDGTFLGSNVSDENGLVHWEFKVARPPGKYTISLSTSDEPSVPAAVMTLQIRSCIRGEVTPSPVACQPCQQGFFSFDPSQKVCNTCPGNANEALCSGGDVITPLPGYWRSSTDSVQIHRCPNPTACKPVHAAALTACAADRMCGASSTYKNLQCAPEYYGNVCGLCLPGTGATKLFGCRDCMKSGVIIALYITSAVVLLCLIKFMCYLNHKQDAAVSHSDASVAKLPAAQLLRPLLLYSQYMLVVSSMPVEWPATIGYPLRALAGLWSPASPETLSIDCLLPRGTDLPISIQKVLFYVCSPIVILGGLLLVEMAQVQYMRVRKKHVAMQVKDLLHSSALVAVFFFYPSILRNLFSMFACIPLDRPAAAPYTPAAVGLYWVMDMNQQCFTGYHRAWALGFGLPCVLLGCLGLPLGVLVLMLNKRADLAEPTTRQHYGFLYMSYRQPMFFWECVVMVQTMVLVAVNVFGVNLGAFYQAIVMNAALILMGTLLLVFKPYAYHQAGKVMLQAVLCLLLTSYTALTFLQLGSIQPSIEYGMIMGSMLLLMNLVYVVSVVWQMVELINWKEVWNVTKSVCAKLKCNNGCINRLPVLGVLLNGTKQAAGWAAQRRIKSTSTSTA